MPERVRYRKRLTKQQRTVAGRKEALLGRLRQNPGLTENHELFEEMEAEGLIFSHRWDWSDKTFWYPAGHDISKLFQPDRYRDRQAVKTYIDPSFKGSWQPSDPPTRSRVADIRIDDNWREKPSTPTEETMTRTKENYDKVIAAIQQAEQEAIANGTYKLPSRNAIGLSVDLPDYLYASTESGRKAKAAYDAAQTRLTLKRAELENREVVKPIQSPPTLLAPPATLLSITTTPQTPDLYQQKLEEENERLRAEIEALKTQIQQAPTATFSNDRTLLQTLKDEDQRLRAEADQVLLQIDELQRQHQRLLTEADAIGRLIEQREATLERVEQTQVAFVAALAETNGHKQLAGVA